MKTTTRLTGLLQSPRVRRAGAAAFALFVLIGIVGFLVLPSFIKSALLEQASLALHRPVSVASVSINPYTLSIRIDGLSVQDGDADKGGAGEALFAFDSLYINVSASSLFHGAPVIEELRLERPVIRLRRLAAQRYNVSDLIDEFLSGPSSPTPAFAVNNIQISGGNIEFDDRVTDEKHRVTDIELALPFVSSLPQAIDAFVTPAFSARIDGSPLALGGRAQPFSATHESEIAIAFKGFDLTRYVDYAPLPLPLQIRSAVLDGDLKIAFHQPAAVPNAANASASAASLSLSGSASLANVRVDTVDGERLLGVDRLEVVVGDFDPGKRHLQLDRVALTQPEVFAHARADGTLNWLALREGRSGHGAAERAATAAPAVAANKPAPVAASVPAPAVTVTVASAPVFTWMLGEATVRGAKLHWRDESRGNPVQIDVDGLDASLHGLASTGGKPARFAVSGHIDGGERISGSFALKDGELDLAGRRIALGDVGVDKLAALVRRGSDGAIDFIAPPALRQAAAAAPKAPASVAANAAASVPAKPAASAAKAVSAAEPDWQFAAKRVHGENIDLRFDDQSLSPAAKLSIEGSSFVVEDFSSAPGARARIKAHFSLNRKGAMDIAGDVGASPLDAKLQLDLQGIELLPFQPYFTERLNLAVTRGQATVKGTLRLQQAADHGTATAALAGGFTGQATIGDFFAVDKVNSADFLRWKSFYFGDIDVSLGPDSVSIGEIALSDFFARVIVSPAGKLNLTQIVREQAPAGSTGALASVAAEPALALTDAAAAAPPDLAAAAPAATAGGGKASVPLALAEKPALPIRIGKVTLQGGSVNFSDNFVKPNYSANLRQIGGRINGLSSAPGTVATLDLRGSYDRIAPLSIKARLNPLAKDPFLDLEADVKGVEMTSFSPYSGKYAGYSIAKGKLSLFVKYRIENRQLLAENRVFVDQLTFGDPVDSPDATRLPVTLAVALLKNRAGEIDINLPVSGSLDDPQFSVGGLVIKVIVNLLVKAVTSPFALLGSLFGGGEELSHVDFAVGRATLDTAAQQRLDKLATALIDRPALKLEITGSVDTLADREGLKLALIERKMRRLKRDDLTKKGIESGSADEIDIAAGERTALLERVYRAEKFPKPRNLVGLVKSLPAEEMEKLIVTNTQISDDDLRELGDRRAARVRDWLVEKSSAPADRIFLLPAKLIGEEGRGQASGKADAAKGSGVDFSLR